MSFTHRPFVFCFASSVSFFLLLPFARIRVRVASVNNILAVDRNDDEGTRTQLPLVLKTRLLFSVLFSSFTQLM